MPPKRKTGRNRPRDAGGIAARRDATQLTARKARDENAWELVLPRCAVQRMEDLQEVRSILDAGEHEVAVDELRWLLGGCSDMLDAHKMLGELALLNNDLPLARGHFGYAYQLGIKAIERAGARGTLPFRLPANQPFFEAGKGLVHCLRELGRDQLAREAVEQLLKLDPSDPLGIGELLPRGG